MKSRPLPYALPANSLNDVGESKLPPKLKEALLRLPVTVDRTTGADLVHQFFFPIGPAGLEQGWEQVPVFRINGRAVHPTVELFEMAYAKMLAAGLEPHAADRIVGVPPVVERPLLRPKRGGRKLESPAAAA